MEWALISRISSLFVSTDVYITCDRFVGCLGVLVRL